MRLGGVCLLTITALLSLKLQAQRPEANEYEVKAAYLYNFSKFVEWPREPAASANEPFAICVFGKDPFGPLLDAAVSGESIDGRSQVAKRISKPQEALGCHILFVGASEDKRLKELLTVLDKTSVLTVSDMPNFSQRGGMIQFVSDGKRIRFEINLTSATDAGLVLSSDLLKVAVNVIGSASRRG